MSKAQKSLRDWFQNSNSRENSESLQDLSSSASCSAPTTSAASMPMSKQKSAGANDLRVDDPKQVRLRPSPASLFGTKKKCFNAVWYQRWDRLEYSVKFDVTFCFPYSNFESKAGRGVREMR